MNASVLFRAVFRCFVVLSLVVSAACHRQPPRSHSYDGTWVMKIGDRVLIVLRLQRQNDGSFAGSVSGPKTFDMAMGKDPRLSHITMPVRERKISSASIADAHLRIVVDDPDNPGEPDNYDMTLIGGDQASLKMVDVPDSIPAFPFTRSQNGEVPRVATDWDPQRTYKLHDEPVTSSAEMRQIYDDDQRPRQDFMNLSKEQWDVLSKADAVRRHRTYDLLLGGKLHSSEDFREAAFIFQHADTPNDYLIAHTLAMIAVAKGDEGALWIGTATLDRYLQSIHRAQIYGTQFNTSHEKITQDPFDRTLIPDVLRLELGVPDLAAQREQFKTFENAKPGEQRPK